MEGITLVMMVTLCNVIGIRAWIAMESTNTDNGYCDYGILIPVGETAIDKENCISIKCLPGAMKTTGCAPMLPAPRPFHECRLIPGNGTFPDCCPHIEVCVRISNEYFFPVLPPPPLTTQPWMVTPRPSFETEDDISSHFLNTSESGDLPIQIPSFYTPPPVPTMPPTIPPLYVPRYFPPESRPNISNLSQDLFRSNTSSSLPISTISQSDIPSFPENISFPADTYRQNISFPLQYITSTPEVISQSRHSIFHSSAPSTFLTSQQNGVSVAVNATTASPAISRSNILFIAQNITSSSPEFHSSNYSSFNSNTNSFHPVPDSFPGKVSFPLFVHKNNTSSTHPIISQQKDTSLTSHNHSVYPNNHRTNAHFHSVVSQEKISSVSSNISPHPPITYPTNFSFVHLTHFENNTSNNFSIQSDPSKNSPLPSFLSQKKILPFSSNSLQPNATSISKNFTSSPVTSSQPYSSLNTNIYSFRPPSCRANIPNFPRNISPTSQTLSRNNNLLSKNLSISQVDSQQKISSRNIHNFPPTDQSNIPFVSPIISRENVSLIPTNNLLKDLEQNISYSAFNDPMQNFTMTLSSFQTDNSTNNPKYAFSSSVPDGPKQKSRENISSIPASNLINNPENFFPSGSNDSKQYFRGNITSFLIDDLNINERITLSVDDEKYNSIKNISTVPTYASKQNFRRNISLFPTDNLKIDPNEPLSSTILNDSTQNIAFIPTHNQEENISSLPIDNFEQNISFVAHHVIPESNTSFITSDYSSNSNDSNISVPKVIPSKPKRNYSRLTNSRIVINTSSLEKWSLKIPQTSLTYDQVKDYTQVYDKLLMEINRNAGK